MLEMHFSIFLFCLDLIYLLQSVRLYRYRQINYVHLFTIKDKLCFSAHNHHTYILVPDPTFHVHVHQTPINFFGHLVTI
jgi:hypothetical protein